MSEDDLPSFEESGWIQWFCKLEDHNYFCEIDPDYLRDSLNTYGLKHQFSNFELVINFILSEQTPSDDDFENELFLKMHEEAKNLYGLIHARYILTPRGLQTMREKFLRGDFGSCPRLDCERQNVLPVGTSNNLKIARVKSYCPRCQDIYKPKKKVRDVDGAFFGTSFPHILLSSFEDFTIKDYTKEYIPKIYGFKIYKQPGSKYRNQKERNKSKKK